MSGERATASTGRRRRGRLVASLSPCNVREEKREEEKWRRQKEAEKGENERKGR